MRSMQYQGRRLVQTVRINPSLMFCLFIRPAVASDGGFHPPGASNTRLGVAAANAVICQLPLSVFAVGKECASLTPQ
ncbi:hypothetical protein DPMN_070635 [Dreissena polymorpha]|uniref:Uncharacterized protein n=1 Tax=Dreissena polymorpha TaxID=45954 RepID=A0A9D3Z1C3_DREPO|nr:hypothetical protein DPMN_070635 [Dreissena polymorpha]